MSSKRSSSNKPKPYTTPTGKQKRTYNRNIRKKIRNEELREKYPPFRTISNINIIHIHHQTTLTTINDLINKANETRLYVIDTESETGKFGNTGALIQIQLVHSIHHSTIVLIEVNYLPDPHSTLYRKIKQLWDMIFNNNNKIITWGPLWKEFENFQQLELIQIGNKIEKINLQSDFRDYHNESNTHPEMESRVSTGNQFDTPGDYDDDGDDEKLCYKVKCQCGHPSHYDNNATWSLQDAIELTFEKFLDKTETINLWHCGIDLELRTWEKNWFTKYEYNKQIEQEQRRKMQQYAIDDCTSVAELYFYINPTATNNNQTPELSTTTSRIFYINNNDELSDISEDELIEILKPKFDKHQPVASPQQLNYEPAELIINPTQEDIEEFIEPQAEQQTQTKTKAERQRVKNMKYKWKKKHHPDFQKKIKRAIYAGYDYRKIRSQLLDDNIHTSHDITINNYKQEVVIGFTTNEQLEHAKRIMRANYFSKEQFRRRWQ
jgi:hypothetical protein